MPLPSDYPEFLASDHLSGRTRDILVTRLEDDLLQAPRVLSPRAFAVLEALLPVLLPQEDILGNSPLNLAVRIDTALAGPRDGWRFAELPPDVTAWEQALLTLDDLAQAQHSMPFPALNASEIGETLDELAEGRHGINAANRLTPEQMQKWSFDLRADAIECFLADARVQDALGISANLNGGDGVFQGFQTVDANERESFEPSPKIPSAKP